MNPLASRIKELEEDIDLFNPNSGIHKGHWTFEDTQKARLEGLKEGARLALETLMQRLEDNCIDNYGRDIHKIASKLPKGIFLTNVNYLEEIKALMAELDSPESSNKKTYPNVASQDTRKGSEICKNCGKTKGEHVFVNSRDNVPNCSWNKWDKFEPADKGQVEG